MSTINIPTSICAVVAELYVDAGSHATLDALFQAAGAPGDPPEAAHHLKWKTWLIRAVNDPDTDALAVIGQLLCEFMDIPPLRPSEREEWQSQRNRIIKVLEDNGFQYFTGGRVLPKGEASQIAASEIQSKTREVGARKPSEVEELLRIIIRGLPRAIYPLVHRRKGLQSLTFDSEYDIQDLLHAQLRPWINDIRAEEFTPSYAGSSTRMDFLLPEHGLVLETKRIRDKSHAAKVGDELIIDIEHYRKHPDCHRLWCVIYDPLQLIQNPSGIVNDLEGQTTKSEGSVSVQVFIFGA